MRHCVQIYVSGKVVGIIHVKEIIKYNKDDVKMKYNASMTGPYCWMIDDSVNMMETPVEVEGNENPIVKKLLDLPADVAARTKEQLDSYLKSKSS